MTLSFLEKTYPIFPNLTIECIDQINKILGFIINVAIITGICFLIFFYYKLRCVELKIESIHNEFEKRRDGLGGEGVTTEIRNRQIDSLEKDRDKAIAPLERERQRIITKIPFIK